MKYFSCAVFAIYVAQGALLAQEPNVYAKLRHGNRDIVNVSSISFSPDGKILAVGYFLSDANPVRNRRNAIVQNETGEVVLWDVARKNKLTVIKWNSILKMVTFSPDGKLLAVADSDNLKILDAVTLKDRHQISVKPSPDSFGWITSMAFSPDSKILAIGTSYPEKEETNSTRLILWDMVAGRQKALLKGGKLFVSSLSFSKDGKLLVSVSEDVVKIWDRAEKERNSFFVGRGNAAVISPDSSVIAVSTIGSRKYSGLNAVKLYDSFLGKERINFHCNLSATTMLFLPDGKRLLTSNGGLIIIRDIKTGKALSAFDGPPINCLSFSKQGHLLASGNQTGSVWLWNIPPLVETKEKSDKP